MKYSLGGGWIYIFFTSENYDRCKIGKTINNPLVRFRNLRTGDPFLALRVAYFIPEKFGSIYDFENNIHFEFQDHRIETYEETNSEWFTISAEDAELWIDGYLEDWCNQKLQISYGVHEGALTKMYESDIKSIFERTEIDDFFSEIKFNSEGPFS